MKIRKKTLPNDIEKLKKILLETEKQLSSTEKQLSSTEKQLSSTEKQLSSTEQQLSSTEKQLQDIKNENDLLHEKVYLLTAKLYGKSTEKRKPKVPDLKYRQYFDIFPLDYHELDISKEDRADIEKSNETEEKETITIEKHERKKSGRKPIPEELPRREIIHDIEEKDKQCGCGCTLSKIGEEVTEQLEIEPAKIYVNRHIRPKYACKNCEGLETEGQTVKTSKPVSSIIPKSIAGASLLAFVMTAKFMDSLPFYRQEEQFKRFNIDLHRNTMSGWVIKLSEKCTPLIQLIKEEILSFERINMDETTIQVMNEHGKSNNSKSYMWVFTGGPPNKPYSLYHYSQTRSGTVAKDFLSKYKGFVQTDGYSGYDFLDKEKNITHAGCFAHARRKFTEVLQGGGGKSKGIGKKSLAEKALNFISQLYKTEKEIKDQIGFSNPEKVLEYRKAHSLPTLNLFYQWLIDKKPQVPPKTLLGKAINYTLNQWHRLNKYVENPYLTPDNNKAENAIRPFVVGRKNWLFAGSPRGAEAAASMYTLIETAKNNGIDPHRYLRALFENLPYAKNKSDYKRLLPQNIDLKLL